MHNVWIAYGGDTNDYVMKISPPPSPSPSPSAPTQGIVSGTIAYAQRVATPSNAIVHVEIRDALQNPTTMKLEPVKIAEVDIRVEHQIPRAFSIAYELAKIDPQHHYFLLVTIAMGGEPVPRVFSNRQAIPIITYNNPTAQIEVQVDPVPVETPSPS